MEPETLEQVARDSQEIAAFLDASGRFPVRIVWKPTLTGPDEILSLCLEANSSPACIGVITWMHTFSPAKMWIAGLTRLDKPLAHLHTQYNRDLPWGDIDMDFMNLNQSAHGDREFGFIGARLRLHRKIVVGHWQDEEVLGPARRLGCAPRKPSPNPRRLKVARFGGMNMREVAVTGGDRVEAQIKFGWSVNGYAMGDLAKRIAEVEDAAVDRLLEEYEDRPTGSRPSSCKGGAQRGQPPQRRPAGAGHARLPGGGPFRGLHHHLRGPARPRPAARVSPASGSWPTATASERKATGRRPPWCGS